MRDTKNILITLTLLASEKVAIADSALKDPKADPPSVAAVRPPVIVRQG